MEEQFIPYEQALELKELGFDEECFRVKLKKSPEHWYTQTDYEDYPDKKEEEVLVPLWQQAFEWFLNRGYFADIKPDLIVTSLWSYRVVDINSKYNPENLHSYRFTYYREARLECLKKLIELCKNVK